MVAIQDTLCIGWTVLVWIEDHIAINIATQPDADPTKAAL